jgi:hypothetical protein
MFGRLPSGTEQWWVSFQLMVWGTLSWLLHPLVWTVAGPFRWAAILQMTAAQESTYNATVGGDLENGTYRSVGVLQFYDSTWEDLEMGSLDRRTSVFWQSWAAGKYVGDALVKDFGWWWRLAVPYIGAAYFRTLWTNGINSGIQKTYAEVMAKFDGEGASRAAWNSWRLISLVPAVAVFRMTSRMRK